MNKFIGIIIAILFLLQFSFLPAIGINMNLLLAVVIILAQRRFDFSGFFWIFLCGILMDIFSARMFGVNTLSFILIALLANFANNFFVAFGNNKWINGVLYLAGKIVFDVMKYYLGIIFVMIKLAEFNVVSISGIFSLGYLLETVVFAFIALLLLVGYKKLEKITGEKRQELIINKF